MSWLRWLKRRREDTALIEWRRDWATAVEAPDRQRAEALRARLSSRAQQHDDEDELEREMLEGLDSLVALTDEVDAHGLPSVTTGHRAARDEVCHFSTPASLPDDPDQPAGTLLFTPSRAVFVGGARAMSVPWHTVSACVRQDRDLLLVRRSPGVVHRIRFNTYGDVLRAACLAGRLSARRPPALR
jgi:hypothetical protein